MVWKSAGKYQTSNGRGFLPLDKSQGKHPKPSPHPQIPVDADWTSSSAIFTVCRRIDLLMRKRLVPLGVRENRERGHGLGLCMHINRDNRGSPGAAYRVGDGRGGGKVHEDARLAKGVLRRDSTCKWFAFIVRRERRMNMWSGKRNKKKKKERETVEGQRREWNEEWSVRGNSHGGIEKWRN